MLRRSLSLPVLLIAGVCLAPAIAHADLRIEETNTSLDSKVTRWTAIKGNKRAVVTRAETKGLLYDAGARYGAYVEIARPDREVLWELDPQERNYREITADSFSKLLQKGIQIPRSPDDQPLRSLYRSQTTAIEVVPTGKTRRIAGYDAEQVMARVVVGAQNLVSGNQFNYTFDQEIWITRDDQVLKEVRGFEEAYTEAFGTAASLQQAQVLAGQWSDAFITHLRSVSDRVRALGGFPLSVTTTVTEEAVAQAKSEKSTARKFVVGTNEVRKITLESIPDSEFELPVGYINQDTKVVVAGPKGSVPTETTTPTGASATGSQATTAGEHPMPTQVATNTAPPVAPVGPKPTMPAVAVNTQMPSVPTTTNVNPTPAAPTGDGGGDSHRTAPAVAVNTNPNPAHTDNGTGGNAAATSPGRNTGSRPSVAAPARTTPQDTDVQPVYVQSAPSNVIVPGAPAARAEKPRGKTSHKQADPSPAIGGTGAVPFISFTTTQAPPPPVTVDEPEYIHKKKKH